MATEILATGSGPATSEDVAVESSTIVALKGHNSDARIAVEAKDDAGGYTFIGSIESGAPATVVAGPATYRFRRETGTCGLFRG